MSKIRQILRWVGITTSSFIFSLMIAHSALAQNVYMEEMTWMEIRDRMRAGAHTVIIPIGGTEQNGPHMITGKHNIIVRYTAGEIAKRVGNTLVAPVISYVPEGRITPPEGHMNFPGTLSVRDNTFRMLLEDAAASLKQHGFRRILFIGDHGGSQKAQQDVAGQLNGQWASSSVTVMNIGDYYAKNGQEQHAEKIGARSPNPAGHAALIDTSEMMAIHSQGIRNELRARNREEDFEKTGANGDSTQASADHGRAFLGMKIEAAVQQIKQLGY
ncbi:MAG: creatininase family protein [Alphaproteobacteria bacterium]